MTKIITFTCILFIGFILSSCSIDEVKKMSPAVNEIKLKTDFRINLPEDHNDGYTWSFQDDQDHRLVEMINSAWHGNEKGVDFNFTSLAAGQTTLTFVKRKYTDTAETRYYIVKILDN